jgi:hypothetical protein
MNGLAVTFLAINAICLLLFPRRWAPVPFLMGACYMTVGNTVEIGPFSFSAIRLLVIVGVIRVVLRGERLVGKINAMDVLVLTWAAWNLTSSVFHQPFRDALILRLGLVYNACGIYFLLRIFCQSLEDVVRLARTAVILLVPVAVEMVWEKSTGFNLFSLLGDVSPVPASRLGAFRAQGPFAHSILAGTLGAVSIPLMIALWREQRVASLIGLVACVVIIFTSTSSGPVMTAIAAIGALWMWRFRQVMHQFKWMAVLGYVVLSVVMTDPAYYIIARIDFTGGSTGYHRARLIQTAFEHLPEWWLAGTDYTRHWMPTGVSWSPDHADITNYYLRMGVWGGLPLMLLFIAILIKGFSFVGQIIRSSAYVPSNLQFTLWALGASLFAHAVTFISVSYYDQSFVFLYLTLALISSAWSGATAEQVNVEEAVIPRRKFIESTV